RAVCPGLSCAAVQPFAWQHGGPDTGRPSRRGATRHGWHLRLLRSLLASRLSARLGRAARQPLAAAYRDGTPWLRTAGRRMVALHPARRTLAGYDFRLRALEPAAVAEPGQDAHSYGEQTQ